MKLENNLGTDNIKKLVLRLAIPSMLAQFVSVLYSIVDRMYIGNIPEIGETALAGVGVCGPIVTLISSFATLIGIGGAPLLSISMGEKDEKKAKQILANCFMMLLAISIIITISALLLKEKLIMWFGASQVTSPYANTYMTIYVLGTVFAILSIGLNQYIICQGFAKVGMKSVILGAIINIILDPILIFVFDMGVAGAALATVLSQMFSCIYVIKFLFGDDIPIKISFGGYSKKICMRVITLGFTPFLIIAFDNILIITMNTVLQRYGGPERGDMLLACTTILQSFMLMITMPLGGITGGTQAILGYNYGAKNSKRVLLGERQILKISVVFVIIMFVLAQTVPEYFVRIFTQKEEYIEITVWAIRIYTLGIIPLGFQYTFVDGFTAIGIAKIAISLSFFRKLIFFLCVFLIPAYFDIEKIFYTEPISDIIAAIVTTSVYLLLMGKILKARESFHSTEPFSHHRK